MFTENPANIAKAPDEALSLFDATNAATDTAAA